MSFEEFLHELGLKASNMKTGVWHRCPTFSHPHKKNGSYKLDHSRKIGWALDFANDLKPHTWRDGNTTVQEAKQIIKKAKVVTEENNESFEKAFREMKEHYKQSEWLRFNHPYLTKKMVSIEGCYGLKTDNEGNLVVPMYKEGHIMSIQRISEEGAKLFWKGCPVKNAYFPIKRERFNYIILCEGIATALTIFQSTPDSNVLACFSAGNIVSVADFFKEYLINHKVIICADNDLETLKKTGKNPGIESAEKASKLINATISIPDYPHKDWNDFFVSRIDKIKKQESLKKYSYKTVGFIRKVAQEEINFHIKKYL